MADLQNGGPESPSFEEGDAGDKLVAFANFLAKYHDAFLK